MINSYRFFQNKECEYFPCHKTENEEEFNCLFCYCPLYREKKCIGNPVWFLNAKGQKMKDCSQCEVIHRSEAYDKVMQQLQRQDEIISLNIGNIFGSVWHRLLRGSRWIREHTDSIKGWQSAVLEKFWKEINICTVF